MFHYANQSGRNITCGRNGIPLQQGAYITICHPTDFQLYLMPFHFVKIKKTYIASEGDAARIEKNKTTTTTTNNLRTHKFPIMKVYGALLDNWLGAGRFCLSDTPYTSAHIFRMHSQFTMQQHRLIERLIGDGVPLCVHILQNLTSIYVIHSGADRNSSQSFPEILF